MHSGEGMLRPILHMSPMCPQQQTVPSLSLFLFPLITEFCVALLHKLLDIESAFQSLLLKNSASETHLVPSER